MPLGLREENFETLNKYRAGRWLYWRYRKLVDWLAALNHLRVIPAENLDLMSTASSRYFTIKQWTERLKKGEVSEKDFATVIKNEVYGAARYNVQEQYFDKKQDLIPPFPRE